MQPAWVSGKRGLRRAERAKGVGVRAPRQLAGQAGGGRLRGDTDRKRHQSRRRAETRRGHLCGRRFALHRVPWHRDPRGGRRALPRPARQLGTCEHLVAHRTRGASSIADRRCPTPAPCGLPGCQGPPPMSLPGRRRRDCHERRRSPTGCPEDGGAGAERAGQFSGPDQAELRGSAYSAPVDIDAGSSPLNKVIALSGRDPQWAAR